MTEVYLENRGRTDTTEHSKFYRATDDGRRAIFNWGPVGGTGQSKVASEDPDQAVRAAVIAKQIKSKVKKGYVIVSNGTETSTVMVNALPTGGISRGFGVELETTTRANPDQILAKLVERGVNILDRRSQYFHSDGRQWDLKKDGSCGFEYASPILRGEGGIYEAKLAADKIREVCPNAINANCGLHVTIGVEDFNDQQLVQLIANYLRFQDLFYDKVAASRKTNSYCSPNRGTVTAAHTLQQALVNVSANNRYQGLNLTRLRDRKAIEFRMMEGSISARKIGEWVRTVVGFVEAVKNGVITTETRVSQENFDAAWSRYWQS